jgi:ATP-binding cassette subfamily C protein
MIGEYTERIRRNLFWGAFLPTNLRVGFEFAAILMILGGLVYGLSVDRTATPQILMLMALVARLFPRLLQWQQLQNTLNLTAPAYDMLVEAHREFESRRESLRFGGHVPGVDRSSLDISVRNLSVCYGAKTILDDISLDIPAGHVFGLVGASGAGKSTLIDAILGLVPPSAGEIVVGEVALWDANLALWRRKIGYVAQETFLFHDTIANNIRWSMPDAPMPAVEEAAKAAGLHDFVKSLPAGYDTIVGDRGARISGGQRQRISIAHALIRKPALLVLDEATSALDSLSEKEIMTVINGLRGRMTVLIVAHRLSIVREADQICVLDHGKVAEQGSWAELSRRKALFHRLIKAQVISDEP